MKLNRIKIALIYLVVAASIACKDADLKKFEKSAQDIAITINAADAVKRNLGIAGLLSSNPIENRDIEIKLTNATQKISDANKIFQAQIKATSTLTGTTKKQLLDALHGIVTAINDLNAHDLLGIKNPDSKIKFSAAIAAISTVLATLEATLGG